MLYQDIASILKKISLYKYKHLFAFLKRKETTHFCLPWDYFLVCYSHKCQGISASKMKNEIHSIKSHKNLMILGLREVLKVKIGNWITVVI